VHVELPRGITVGHHTDLEAWTGCTVILLPEGTVAAAEVRGGGPGTRESELLAPAANAQGVHAVLFTGGSAFGLGAADGVMTWLADRGIGYAIPGGPVPLVFAAVVYDLVLGDGSVRPRPEDAAAACDAATTEVERGSVGVGTGCTVGKLRATDGWTKGGLGAATRRVGDVTLTALAAVNAFGDVLAADGSIAAGVWTGEGYTPTTELLARGELPRSITREATTLVCLLTDARLDKREAWLVARAGSAGVARAVAPSATAADGDLVVCAASGDVLGDPFVLSAIAPEVIADAIRDAVASATDAPGCPTAASRRTSR
jgi:L-aminopeptidase/D-esterase-like protein